MAGQIAEAYVQIIPTTTGIASGIADELGDSGEKGGKSLVSRLMGTFKKLAVAAGIGKLVKSALDAGGAVQQSFGGLETIYGDAAAAAQSYAREAASAGISMNSYAEQAVSFGAALKQAYGGDTTAAMQAANTAILDMADNSAKMGTDMSAIQAAYQGFAKQNYTMLDNLKLGYGGTKTEMERLLADATAISGIEYNIDNLGDVYDAIHVIQQDLGLTGVAAEEASTTLTGSFGAMKAAATNFLADLALGNDLSASLGTLTNSIVTWAGNMLPMVANIIGALPQTITTLLTGLAPMLLSTGMDAIMQLGAGIAAALPGLISSIAAMIPQIVSGIAAVVPQLLSVGTEIVTNLWMGIVGAIPGLVAAIPGMISEIAAGFSSSVGIIANAAISLFQGLGDAIPVVIPQIVAALPEIITSIVTALAGMSADLIIAGMQMMVALAEGLVQAIPQVLAAIPQIWEGIKAGLAAAWPELQAAGREIMEAIKSGISAMLGSIGELAQQIWEPIKAKASEIWTSISGVVSSAWQAIKNAVKVGIMLVASVIGAAVQIITLPFQMIWENCKSFVVPIWESIKAKVSAAMEAIGNTITSVWSAITSFLGPALTALQSAFSSVWSAITGAVSAAWSAIKSAVSAGANAVKSVMSSVFSAAAATVSGIWNGIKSTITNVMNSVKSTVQNAINKVKSIVNFSWSLPHLKLPHFSIVGEFSLHPPSVPHLSVSWNAKGAVLTAPTIFGMQGNTLLGGGEAGPEAVAPISVLQRYIRDAVSGSTVDATFEMNGGNAELIAIVKDLSDKLDNLKVVLNTGALVGGIASEMDSRLGELGLRTERGLA